MSRTARRHESSGQALLEFALIFPVLILLLMGIVDFGRAIFAYNTVSEAARIGGRVAIVNQTTSDICLVAASRAIGLGLPTACIANPPPPGPSGVGVIVSPATSGRGCDSVNCLMSVQVNYDFKALIPVISNLVGPIRLSSTTKVPVESVCYLVDARGSPCPKP